jgi:glutamine synthetase adenylyltransferase
LGRRFITWKETFVYGEPAGPLPETAANRPAEDIERFTQWLQLRNGAAHPAVRHGGTLASLEAVGRVGAIDEAVRRDLDHAYIILRSAEHRLQLGVKEDADKQLAVSRDRVREICAQALQQ